jgi:hypothetical protein
LPTDRIELLIESIVPARRDQETAIDDAHNFPPDFPSPEIATGVLGILLSHPNFYSVVAERDGKIVGSNFLDERGPIARVGPITVNPAEQTKPLAAA